MGPIRRTDVFTDLYWNAGQSGKDTSHEVLKPFQIVESTGIVEMRESKGFKTNSFLKSFL